MTNSVRSIYRWSLRVAIVGAALSLLLACGPGEAPTPTPTATPTKAPVATATPTLAPAATPTATPRPGLVATPTPTLVATPTPAGPAAEKPQRGGTFRRFVSTDPIDFDLQFLAVSPAYATASGPTYNSLLINYVDEDVECDVCSKWQLANGGKTMVFTLIPGIKFHTGQELTSADVKYSLRMIMGDVDGIVAPRSGIIKEYIESIDTPSRYEVRINLLRPSAYVPKVLANANSVIYRDGTTRADLRKAPAGTGPFVVKEVVPGAGRKLARNPNYFKPGQPYLDAVEITLIVDATTQVASFITGKTDIWQGPSAPAEQFMPLFTKLRDEGKVNWLDFLGGTSLDGTLMYQGKPPFNNLKLRQALNLVIDREKMGLATWGTSLKHPQLMVYSQEAYWSTRKDSEIWNVVPGWGTGAKKQQEIEQAKQLVKDAGYPNGIDIQHMLSSGGGPSAGEAAGEFLQQTLAQIGIRTTMFMTTAAQRVERLESGNFTIFYYLLRQTTKDPDEIVGSNFVTGAPRNYHDYSNPAVDKLFVQMSSELDQAKRKQILGQIVDIVIIQDVAFAPDQGIDSIDVWWKRLHGVQIGQTNHSPPGLMRADRLWLSE